MKVFDSKKNNFYREIDKFLSIRRNKIKLKSNAVVKIIMDVKKNGDKSILKYEKKFSKNNIIVPSSKKIKKLISLLDPKVKKAIDIAYNRIYKFHSLQKVKNILYIDKFKNKLEYKFLPLDSVGIYVPGPIILSTFLIFFVP